MARIAVLSDIHLSPTHGFFWENWRLARELADAAKSDAVIVNGDLAINGPVRANPQYDEGRRDGGLRIEATIGDGQNAATGCFRDRRNPT
jgi:3',5'-cyclic AMP phosphodiesterase CpdA